jgi:hypothetical protein
VTITKYVSLERRSAIQANDSVLGNARSVDGSRQHGFYACVILVLGRNFGFDLGRSDLGFFNGLVFGLFFLGGVGFVCVPAISEIKCFRLL